VGVGILGPGTLTVNGGSHLMITVPAGLNGPGLLIGGSPVSGTQGQGTVTIDGVGSLIQSPNGFMHVGQWGTTSTGTLNITNGGALAVTRLDVSLGDGNPATGHPNSPTTGDVIVEGAGSSVTVSGFISTNGANPGGNIGSLGGTGTLTVRNGATVGMNASGAPNGPVFNVGFNGGTGTVNFQSGAVVTMDGSAASSLLTGGGPLFVVGSNGGNGQMNITGASTSLNITAHPRGGGMNIGAGTPGGTGTVTVASGAGVLITGSTGPSGFSVGGSAGSQGTLNVTSGATLTLKATPTGGGFTIGNTGTGTMTVTGAGTAVLQDGTTTPGATPGVTIGSLAGSNGTLTIQDGAVWTLNRSGAGCCITVGRLGHGALSILSGGKLLINDTSVATNFRLAFGGNATSGTGGTFDALISGVGSELTISGIDAAFALGRATGGSGNMTVAAGATVNADLFHVGYLAGTTASLAVSGSGTTINLVGDPDGTAGAGFTVGAGGMGSMLVDQGAVITIDGTATPQPTGFAVGGSRTSLAGGTGNLTVDGVGSGITILGTQKGFNVGFDNTCLGGGPCNMPSTGTLTVSNGAQILSGADHRSSIGGTPGSTGTAIISGGGSLLDAGAFLGLGKDRDGNLGGTATLTVSAGGTVKAGVINCGAGGTINGDGGTIIGDVIADPGCVIAPGSSPGMLSIIGTLTGAGAKVVLEVDAFGNHDVLAVQGTTTFDPSTQVEVRVDPAFQPAGGSLLQLVQVQATPTDLVVPLLTLLVSSSGGGTVTVSGDLKTLSDPIAVVPDITIDPTVRLVEIDIKPGEFPNVIHLGAQGTLPVAIISTTAFDALTVDPQTISLHSVNSTTWTPNANLVGKGDRAQCSAQDVNGDGRLDLLCHIVISTLSLAGESIAVLDAMTFTSSGPSGGIPIRGSDFIKIVP